MRMWFSLRARVPGQLHAALGLVRRVNKVVAAATALVMAVALAVAVSMAAPRQPGPPAQAHGAAAGRPHRVPASATMGRLLNGTVVPLLPARAAKGGRPADTAGALPARLRPRGAVPPSTAPSRLKLATRVSRGRDRVHSMRSPAPPPVRGFNPQTSRVLSAGTSANRVVYQNADGTRTALIYQTPANYRQPDGSWARIDTSLAPVGGPGAVSSTPSPSSSGQASTGWRERSAAEPVTFAAEADASPLAVLPLNSTESVGFGVQGAAPVAGKALADTVTYPAVRPGADLRLVAGTWMLDEQLILHSAAAPGSWVFPLRLDGLHALTGPGGVIEFADTARKIKAVVPPGLMTDSKVNPHSGSGAVSDGVSYTLTTVGGQPAIRMTLDTAWLNDPARVFPVTVDPSVSSVNSNGTTYVLSGYTSDFSGGPEIDAGTYDGGTNVARAFMKFDGVSSSLANDNVLGVRLGVFNTWSYSCSPRAVEVYPVTSSWSVSGAKSYPGPATGGSIGSKSFATGWVPLGSTVSPCPASWEGIDLNQAGTQLVNGWTHGTTANNGLALGASSSDSYAWKKFSSGSAANGDPFLAITYTPDGARYALASTQPVQQVEPNQNGVFAVKVTNTGSATWTPTNGYELSYEAYDSAGKLAASHPVFTPMPSTVAPGATVTVDAKVNALKVGSYAINFDMYSGATGSSPVSFVSQGIAPLPVGLSIPQPPPTVTAVYPPTGFISSTVTPELSTTAFSTIGTAITYKFTLTCQPLPGTTCPGATVNSPSLTVPYWTTPALAWNEPYTWTVTATTNGSSTTVGPVTITPEVPQPVMTSGLGGSGGQAFDPQSGNFTTGGTDAAVAVAGPALAVNRTYNSLNPQASGAFGAGWSAAPDAAVIPDNDGSGSVVVVFPDGKQLRFGAVSGASTYVPPMGSPDVLTRNPDGTWTLVDASGNQYEFASGGRLVQITDTHGLTQTVTSNSAGQVTSITDTASGRALHLTWSTPAGARYPHVASVATDPPAAGQSGLTWTYSYTGDKLTQVCAPSANCTGYTYGAGSNYRSAALDSGPRSYWQLGDPSGSASAADEVDANLGTTTGSYSNVSLGAAGPLAGSSETAASFNGTSSSVTLPANLISDQNYVSVGLWFKAANLTASGVLFGSQTDALSNSAGNSAPHVPELYVGGNGKLYGELWNGSVDPMSSSVTVDDGNWHYAVLTGSGTTQSLWLDGTQVGTLAGQITAAGLTNDTAGAGFWGNWPQAYANQGPASVNTPVGYFAGSIGQAAVYPHPLGQPVIAGQYALAVSPSAELTQVTLPSGRISQQAGYDAAEDRVATYTDSHGGQWQIHLPLTTGYKPASDSLDVATRQVTVVDPAGYDEVYGYDALNGGRQVSYTTGNGDAPKTFGYDAAGFLNQVQDSDGNIVTYTNDIRGNVLSRTWSPVQPAAAAAAAKVGPQAAAASSCTTTGAACTAYYSYYYNAANPLDPRNNELTAVRDARSASATDNTYLTAYAYNAAGELTSSTTPAAQDFPSGRTTGYAYSTASTAGYGGGTLPAGLLVSQTTPGGAVTSYSYYSDGDLAQVTLPSGPRTVHTYDALGRAATATAYSDTYPSGLATTYTYNAVNQPLTVTSPGATDPVGGVTHTLQTSNAYDADGNLTQQALADLTGRDVTRTTSYTYNDHGERASVTDPAGATTGYSYNPSGHVSSRVDADGNEYDYTYNEYGKVTQVTLTGNSTSQANPGGGSSLVLDSYAYDPAGLLATTTDAMGRSTGYSYDANQDLIAAKNVTSAGTGRQTAYTYDGAGNLVQKDVSDLPVTKQTITSYTVDPASRVTSVVVDPTPAGTSASGYANRTTTYSYDADNHVAALTVTGLGGSSTTNYAYNAAGELTSQVVPDGATSLTSTRTYNQLGEVTSVTSPDGNAAGATAANYLTSYAYDQAGRLVTVTRPPVATQSYAAQPPATTRPVTSYAYDTFGDQTTVRDPDGNTTATGYDADGRATSVTQPDYTPPGSTTAITATTSTAYDGLGNRTKVTDPLGNITSYAYDSLGDLTSRTDPQLTGQASPGVWAYTYDSDGEQLSAASPTGVLAQATYDGFGEQITATKDVATSSGTQYDTTTTTYDYLGDPLTVTSPAGAVVTNTYDHLGELASAADLFGNTTRYTYDYAGHPFQVANPDGTSASSTYDAAGNLTATTSFGVAVPPATAPVLATRKFGHDPSGNPTSVTDPVGVTTTSTYNAANELTSTAQPVSSSVTDTTSFGYDPAGNQTEITDGNGNATWTAYNAWNLAESVIEPATAAATTAAQRTWTTSYDADGRAASVSQPGGVSLTYTHDQLGDLTAESGSGAAASTPAQSFGYNTSGQLVSASAPGGTDTFGYDGAGDLTAASGPSGNATFTYNGDGLMTGRTDAAGTTSYTYDKADRLATTADPLTGATLSYAYNADSLPASVSYATGGVSGPVRSYAYDGLARLTSDILAQPSGTAIASAAYGYNANGDLTSQATTGYAGAASTSYGYNQADQLTSATTAGTTTSYGYDAASNLTKAGPVSDSYNAQDQLTSSTAPAGTTGYGYTLSGALASVTPPSGGAQAYTSNAYGQTVTVPGGISYGYDALGRLVTRATSAATASLAYSGAGNALASDGTGRYSYDPSGALVGTQPSGGTAAAALSNIHGDVTGTFSPAAGSTSLAGSAAYSPYGAVTAKGGAMPGLGYQGQYTDPSTGKVDMAARWYSPATGGFTSNDTLGGAPLPSTADGNPYGYVGGNPLTGTDPTGHGPCLMGGFCIDWQPPVDWQPPITINPQFQSQFQGQFQGQFLGPISEPWSEIAAQLSTSLGNSPNPQVSPDLKLPMQNNGGGCVTCYPWPQVYLPPVPVQVQPPPPPQDRYSNGALPSAAPPWLRTAALMSNSVYDSTNVSALFLHGLHINEQIRLPHAVAKGTSPATDTSNQDQPPICDDPLTSFVKDAAAQGVVAGLGAILQAAQGALAAQSGWNLQNTPAYQAAMNETNAAQMAATYDEMVRGGGGDTCGGGGPPKAPESPNSGNGGRSADPADVALGLNEFHALRKFVDGADRKGFIQYAEDSTGKALGAGTAVKLVKEAIDNPEVTIHVVLDRMHSPTGDWQDMFRNAASLGYLHPDSYGPGTATNWEMMYLDQAVEAGVRPASSVQFWLSGKKISEPWGNFIFGFRLRDPSLPAP